MTTKTETQEKEIQLVQVPKIVHRLQEAGARVTERLKELGVESLVATEDTVKALKELRAELNKELTEFEAQRKWVKEGVLNPYNEFEAIYKAEISEKYKGAIDTLKTKIEAVENKVKAKKRDRVKLFFDELCTAEGLDFIPFDKVGLDINLSTSEKKYKDQCIEFVAKVQDDLNLIRTEEFQVEILAEYKKSLNAAQAITTVRDRKAAEKAEADRLKLAEELRRKKEVIDAGMGYDEFTKAYFYNDEVFLTESFISTASREEYSLRLAECVEKIREDKVTNPQQGEMTFAAPVAAPVTAPAAKKTEELVKAQFEVTGTMAQLQALGQYMRDNNIKYKNI
jgi:hypothetical protein